MSKLFFRSKMAKKCLPGQQRKKVLIPKVHIDNNNFILNIYQILIKLCLIFIINQWYLQTFFHRQRTQSHFWRRLYAVPTFGLLLFTNSLLLFINLLFYWKIYQAIVQIMFKTKIFSLFSSVFITRQQLYKNDRSCLYCKTNIDSITCVHSIYCLSQLVLIS